MPNFPQLVHERLDLLNSSVVLFLTELDSQVLRLNACYVEEVAAIRAARQEQESSRTRTASHAEGAVYFSLCSMLSAASRTGRN